MMPPDNRDDFDLELELRQALRRVEPEKDFSALSYARPHSPWYSRGGMWALAAALILIFLLPAGVIRYEARQQRREEAGANLIKALQITENKLQRSRQMVVRQLERRNAI